MLGNLTRCFQVLLGNPLGAFRCRWESLLQVGEVNWQQWQPGHNSRQVEEAGGNVLFFISFLSIYVGNASNASSIPD